MSETRKLRGTGTLYEGSEKIAEVTYDLSVVPDTGNVSDAETRVKGTLSSGETVVDFRNYFHSDALELELENGRTLSIVFEDPRAGTVRSTERPGG